jgi:hypothetical protein
MSLSQDRSSIGTYQGRNTISQTCKVPAATVVPGQLRINRASRRCLARTSAHAPTLPFCTMGSRVHAAAAAPWINRGCTLRVMLASMVFGGAIPECGHHSDLPPKTPPPRCSTNTFLCGMLWAQPADRWLPAERNKLGCAADRAAARVQLRQSSKLEAEQSGQDVTIVSSGACQAHGQTTHSVGQHVQT